jgi:hypothetical protein
VIAGLIGLGFAWLWLLVGSNAAAAAGLPIAIAGSALIAFTAWRIVRRPRARTGTFDAKYYIAAVVGEVIAIIAAQSWLASHRLEALLFPVIGVIVGLHFIGLWLAMGSKRFLWLTGALVSVNMVALLLPLAQSERAMLSGFGSSASLLVSVAA